MALSPLPVEPDDPGVIDTDDEQPLKTYALDIEAGTLGGYVDGTEAIRQFIYKAIRTARFRFPIYDDDYGSEVDALIGQDVSLSLLETEIPRVIEEAIIYDDRIDSVHDFELTREGDRLYVSFYVDIADDVISLEVTI